MVKTTYQYPQYLYAFNSGGESVQLPNGSWSETAAFWELKASCREETNGKGNTIQTAGGETIVFSSLIQLPVGTPRINEGTEILVTLKKVDVNQLLDLSFIASAKISGLIVAQGACQKYDFGRLHCRLWI